MFNNVIFIPSTVLSTGTLGAPENLKGDFEEDGMISILWNPPTILSGISTLYHVQITTVEESPCIATEMMLNTTTNSLEVDLKEQDKSNIIAYHEICVWASTLAGPVEQQCTKIAYSGKLWYRNFVLLIHV